MIYVTKNKHLSFKESFGLVVWVQGLAVRLAKF